MEIKEVNSVFEQPWWFDAVAPNQWGCFTVHEQGRIFARLPYMIKRRGGICMPNFTQTVGPWCDIRATNHIKVLSQKKELYEHLIEQFPKRKNIDLVLDCSVDYFLPFRWCGFKVEPTISYRFSDLTNLDAIFKGIKDSRRTVIKNASRNLCVRETDDIDLLINMQKKTFRRQGRKLPVEKDVIYRIDAACRLHNASFLLVAFDKEKNVHAASYFVYDSNICYYLMSGSDPSYRDSGAGSLLLWEGIKRAASVSKMFDFEGSNIMDIESNFRSFGAKFVINYRIYRFNLFFTIIDYLKPKLKRLIGYKI